MKEDEQDRYVKKWRKEKVRKCMQSFKENK